MTPPATALAPHLSSPPTSGATAPRSDLTGSTAECLVVIVSPGNGRFHPVMTSGAAGAGTLVARVVGGRGAALDVRLPVEANVAGLLTLPGHLVTRGQALAWARIEPADAA